MSTDYDAILVVGYLVNANAFLAILEKEYPEESHMETRFDPKTGKKFKKPEKVIDEEARTVYEFQGKRFETDEKQELVEAIEDHFKCDMWLYVDCREDEDAYLLGISSSKLSKTESDGETLTFAEVAKCRKDVARIGRAMTKFGFKKLGLAGVHAVLNVQ
jgi:hypothetical protein